MRRTRAGYPDKRTLPAAHALAINHGQRVVLVRGSQSIAQRLPAANPYEPIHAHFQGSKGPAPRRLSARRSYYYVLQFFTKGSEKCHQAAMSL